MIEIPENIFSQIASANSGVYPYVAYGVIKIEESKVYICAGLFVIVKNDVLQRLVNYYGETIWERGENE